MGSYFFLKEEKIDAGMFTLNKKKEMWLLDNGCSRHMIGDKIKLEIKSETKNERLKTKMTKLKIIKKKIKDKPPQDVGGP